MKNFEKMLQLNVNDSWEMKINYALSILHLNTIEFLPTENSSSFIITAVKGNIKFGLETSEKGGDVVLELKSYTFNNVENILLDVHIPIMDILKYNKSLIVEESLLLVCLEYYDTSWESILEESTLQSPLKNNYETMINQYLSTYYKEDKFSVKTVNNTTTICVGEFSLEIKNQSDTRIADFYLSTKKGDGCLLDFTIVSDLRYLSDRIKSKIDLIFYLHSGDFSRVFDVIDSGNYMFLRELISFENYLKESNVNYNLYYRNLTNKLSYTLTLEHAGYSISCYGYFDNCNPNIFVASSSLFSVVETKAYLSSKSLLDDLKGFVNSIGNK